MPLKRSPVVKKAALTAECSKSVSESGDVNETPTFKRKHELVKSPNREDIEELKLMFENYKKRQDSKHNALLQKFTEIQEEHRHTQNSLEFLSKEYDELKEAFKKLQSKKVEDTVSIQQLEEKVTSLDKNARTSGIEIRNVPVQRAETKQSLSEYITDIGKTINQPISGSDIRDIFRTNSKDASNKPIIVDFISTIKKENIIKAIKTYNREHKESKLNSSHLRIEGPAKPIYVSENLSLKTKRLFSLARTFAKNNGYTFCWVAHNVVYLKRSEGVMPVRINSEADIQKISEQR